MDGRKPALLGEQCFRSLNIGCPPDHRKRDARECRQGIYQPKEFPGIGKFEAFHAEKGEVLEGRKRTDRGPPVSSQTPPVIQRPLV